MELWCFRPEVYFDIGPYCGLEEWEAVQLISLFGCNINRLEDIFMSAEEHGAHLRLIRLIIRVEVSLLIRFFFAKTELPETPHVRNPIRVPESKLSREIGSFLGKI